MLGRYEVLAFLGRGGMGEVFRARDTELGRDVAIKVLPPETAENEERLQRFRREARAVARLSHPNILNIHDFGTEAGVSYTVTELLEGSDLRDRLAGAQLPLSTVVVISRAVAEGLAAAHSKGIVHRDIKPGNIFVTTTGQVKILDFGIASLRAEQTTEVDTDRSTDALTRSGQVLGTTSYMSPEQVAGGAVDARSDIFSLGCVMYEMVTGTRAFDGATPNETLAAIVGKDPKAISEIRPDVPASLETLIGRCLEKQPGERFESARDVAYALDTLSEGRPPARSLPGARARRLGRRLWPAALGAAVAIAALLGWRLVSSRLPVTPELPELKLLAVMSFSAGGDDPELRESAAGLERIVADGLTLVERDSRGTFWVVPLDEAERLGAETAGDYRRLFSATVALRGRLQRSDGRLQLDLEILDTGSGRVLRQLSIDDSVSNLTSFQEGPVLRVAELLGVEVSQSIRELLTAMATTMPEGFSATLRGLGIAANADEEGDLDRAIELLERATSLDPLFATGRVHLGLLYLRKSEMSGDRDWLDRALAEAELATADGRALDDGYVLLADVHRALGEPAEALAALETGVRAADKSADAHLELARAYDEAGRLDACQREARMAIFLRPGYWPAHDFLAKIYLKRGEYVAAANEFNEVITFAPGLTKGYNNLGSMLSYLGRADEAREMFERSIAIEPSRAALSNLGTLYFDERRFADAAVMFERALEQDDSRYVTWGNLGFAYKFGPSPEKADECFRRAVELGSAELVSEPGDMWLLASLASYHAMLGEREVGLRLLESAVAEDPVEPQLLAQIAETFEDLGERDRALEWVERSFRSGIEPARFEIRPTLRELVADDRYQSLVRELTGDR
jgi:serine/threonine-protein kinase